MGRNGDAAGKRSTRIAPLVAGLVLSAVFLWLALRDVVLAELATTLAQAAWWPLAPCTALLVGFFWLKAARWRLLLDVEPGVATARLVEPMMIGFAANNVFPLRAGEFIRAYIAGRSLGTSPTRVFASLVVERMLDGLSVAALTGGALLSVHAYSTSFGGDETRLLAAAAAVVLIAVASLLMISRLIRADPSRLFRRLPERVRDTAASTLQKFLAGLEPVTRRRLLPGVLANSLLQWLMPALCIHLSILAVGIETASVPLSLIVLGTVVIGISVPSGPAYIGNIEYAFVLALGLFGVAPEAALAAAIYYHGFSFVGVTTAGAVCWVRHSLRGARGPVAGPFK